MPGQNETDTYIKYIKIINQGSRCHTYDRDNMEAQFDCGIGQIKPDEFKKGVEAKFKFDYRG